MRLPVRRESAENQPSGRGEFERLREALWADLDRWPQVMEEIEESLRDVLPVFDVEETDEAYLFDVELPGVRPDDVDVEVAPGRLAVTAERRRRERVGLLRYRRRTTGRFRLDAALPPDVDTGAVSARFDHGLLHVVMPKVPDARRRRIQVTPRRAR